MFPLPALKSKSTASISHLANLDAALKGTTTNLNSNAPQPSIINKNAAFSTTIKDIGENGVEVSDIDTLTLDRHANGLPKVDGSSVKKQAKRAQ